MKDTFILLSVNALGERQIGKATDQTGSAAGRERTNANDDDWYGKGSVYCCDFSTIGHDRVSSYDMLLRNQCVFIVERNCCV